MDNVEFETTEELDFPDVVDKPSWREMLERAKELSDVNIYNLGSSSGIDWKYLENIVVQNAHIESLDAGKITTGTLAADRIGANSITADHINVGTITVTDLNNAGSLSTYNKGANALGTGDMDTTIISGGKIVTGLLTADNIQAGTLTGRTVQTATSGKRIRLESSPANVISFLNNNDVLGSLEVDWDSATDTGFIQLYSGAGYLEMTQELGVAYSQSFILQTGGGMSIQGWGKSNEGSIQLKGQDPSDSRITAGIHMDWSGNDFWGTVYGTFYKIDASDPLDIDYDYLDITTGDILMGKDEPRITFGSIFDLRHGNDLKLTYEAGLWLFLTNAEPYTDDDYSLGSASYKWSCIYAVDTDFGDIGMENDWKFTESYKIGIKEDGVALLDDGDELRYFFGKKKLYTPENIKELSYTKNTLKERRVIKNPKKVSIKKERRKRSS